MYLIIIKIQSNTTKHRNEQSSDPEPNLLSKVLRLPHNLHLRQTIHLILPRNDIDILRLDEPPRSKPELVTEIQDEKDRQRDIRREEVTRGEFIWPECLEAVGEREEGDDEEDKVGEVGLEARLVGDDVEHVVVDEGGAEAEVGYHYDDPGDEAGDGGDVDEPVEDCCAGVGDVEKGEKSECPGEEDGDVWDL